MPEMRQADDIANGQNWQKRWQALLGLHRLPRLQRGGAGVRDRSDRIIALTITFLIFASDFSVKSIPNSLVHSASLRANRIRIDTAHEP